MAAFLFYDESQGSAIRVNWVQNESSISIGHAHISVDVKQGDDYVSSYTTAHISPPTDRPAPHLMPQHGPQHQNERFTTPSHSSRNSATHADDCIC